MANLETLVKMQMENKEEGKDTIYKEKIIPNWTNLKMENFFWKKNKCLLNLICILFMFIRLSWEVYT